MSLCRTVATCNGGGGWHAQHVGDAWGSHAAEMASVFAAHVRARCASGGPADGRPVASDSSTAAKLFDVSACCHVRACARLARRARVVRACRACSARVCSCARRRAASVGEACEGWASPVRDMPLAQILPGVKLLITSYFCPVGKIFAWRVVSLARPRLAAQSLRRTQPRAASVAACLRCSCHHRAVYRQWAKTHTFVCLYISNNKPCEWLQSNL